MVKIKCVNRLINVVNSRVAPKVFFIFGRTPGERKKQFGEINPTEKDIILTFNRENEGATNEY